MRRRGLVLLGTAAVAAGAGAGLVAWLRAPTRTEAAIIGRPVFPDITPRFAGAREIEIRKADGVLTIALRDGVWGIAERDFYPARTDRVRETLAGLAELRLIEERTSDPGLLSRLGVEDITVPGAASQLVTVKDRAGAPIARLIVGRRRLRTAGNLPEAIFIRRPDDATSWLAEGSLRVDTDPMLWVERDFLDIKRQRVAEVVTHRAGAEAATVRRAGPGAENAAMVGAPEGYAADQAKLDELPRALEWLSFNDVRRADALPEPAEAGTARFTSFDGLALSIRIVTSGGRKWAVVAPSYTAVEAVPEGPEMRAADQARDEAATLEKRLSGWAYQLVDWKADSLLSRPEDLKAQPPANPS